MPFTGWVASYASGCLVLSVGGRGALQKELLTRLPVSAPGFTLQVPEPVGASARPTAEYPFTWAIFRWIEGQTYEPGRVDDECQMAADLAGFIAELAEQ